jgi:hypothetical protein
MQVAVRIWRAVVVNHYIDTFYINSATEDVGSYENTFLKSLECGVSMDSVKVFAQLLKIPTRRSDRFIPFLLLQT